MSQMEVTADRDDTATEIRRGLSWEIPSGKHGLMLARKVLAGTITAQEIVRSLEPLGVWWGIESQYGGLDMYEAHAEVYDWSVSAKQMLKEYDEEMARIRAMDRDKPPADFKRHPYPQYTDAERLEAWQRQYDYEHEKLGGSEEEYWSGCSVPVIFTAKRPQWRDGTPWDPAVHNPSSGMDGNSYLPDRQPLEITEVRYSPDFQTYKVLRAGGIRTTAKTAADILSEETKQRLLADPDTKRLYAVEQQLKARLFHFPQKSIAELQALADRIGPKILVMEVSQPGVAGTGLFGGKPAMIGLGPDMRDEATLIHEMTHVQRGTKGTAPAGAPDHGPDFLKHYLRLLRKYCTNPEYPKMLSGNMGGRYASAAATTIYRAEHRPPGEDLTRPESIGVHWTTKPIDYGYQHEPGWQRVVWHAVVDASDIEDSTDRFGEGEIVVRNGGKVRLIGRTERLARGYVDVRPEPEFPMDLVVPIKGRRIASVANLGSRLWWRVHPEHRGDLMPEMATSKPFFEEGSIEEFKGRPERGYSAFDDPWHLWLYIWLMWGWDGMEDSRTPVLGFTGTRVGTGSDGEDLVMPSGGTVQTFTVREFFADLMRTPFPATPVFAPWVPGALRYTSDRLTSWEALAKRLAWLDQGDPVHEHIVKTFAPLTVAAGAKGDLPEGLTVVHHPGTWQSKPSGKQWIIARVPNEPKQIGRLGWWGSLTSGSADAYQPGEIFDVGVDERYRRRGVASAMLAKAREIDGRVHHSDALSEDGKAWSRKVGSVPAAVTFTVRERGTGATTMILAQHPEAGTVDGYEHWVGHLTWRNDDGEILDVQVDPWLQRKGIATEMLRRAREVNPDVHHSSALTEDGAAWSQRAASTTALPSWRDRGVLPAVECVIAPDLGRASRNSYLVYLYDQPYARRPTLAEAKATVEEVYGPLDWQRIEGDDDEHHDQVWGWTTMFNDAPYYLVVERLPRLGATAARYPDNWWDERWPSTEMPGLMLGRMHPSEGPIQRVDNRGPNLKAEIDGTYVGHIYWNKDTGEVDDIFVVPAYQRRGIATALWNEAKKIEPKVHHSDTQTGDGKGWAARVGAKHTVTTGDYAGISFDYEREYRGRRNGQTYLLIREPSSYVARTTEGRQAGYLTVVESTNEIGAVSVVREHQRQGIATALLAMARQDFPGLAHTTVPGQLSPNGEAWARHVGARTFTGGTIYRGLRANLPPDIDAKVTDLLKMETDEESYARWKPHGGKKVQAGELIVRALEKSHWDSEMGLGRHWSTRREMAATAAQQGGHGDWAILLTATYAPGDVDPDWDPNGAFMEQEDEVRLRPGAKITITQVDLLNANGFFESKGTRVSYQPIRATASAPLGHIIERRDDAKYSTLAYVVPGAPGRSDSALEREWVGSIVFADAGPEGIWVFSRITDPDYRRQGVMTALQDRLEQIAAGRPIHSSQRDFSQNARAFRDRYLQKNPASSWVLGARSQVESEHGPEERSARTGARGVDSGHPRRPDVGPDHLGRDHHPRRDRGRTGGQGPRPGRVRPPLRVGAARRRPTVNHVDIGGPLALAFPKYSTERQREIFGALKAFREGRVRADAKDPSRELRGCFTIPVGGLTTAEPDRLVLVRTKDGKWLAVYAVVNHNYGPASQHVPAWLASQHATHVRLSSRLAGLAQHLSNLAYYSREWRWQAWAKRNGHRHLIEPTTLPALRKAVQAVMADHGISVPLDISVSAKGTGYSEAQMRDGRAYVLINADEKNLWNALHEASHLVCEHRGMSEWDNDHGEGFLKVFAEVLEVHGGIDSVDLGTNPPQHPKVTRTSAWSPFQPPAGIKILTGGDAVPGGYNGYYAAYDVASGEKMGYLDYQSASWSDTVEGVELSGSDVKIAMVEVEPKWRRKGVATVLLDALRHDFPTDEIDPGYTTPDGNAWWSRVRGRVAKVATANLRFEHLRNRSVADFGDYAPRDGIDTLVAYDGATPVGHLSWFSDPDSGVFGAVDALGVAETHRRQGIATALYRRAKQIEPTMDPRASPWITDDGQAWIDSLRLPSFFAAVTESAKSIPMGDGISNPLWVGPGIYEMDISRLSSTRCVALLTEFPGMGVFPIGFLTWDTERYSIEGIFVNEDYRGKGIGVEMKKAAERAAGRDLNTDSGEYTREGLAWAKKHGIPNAKNTSPVSTADMNRMRAQMVNYLMGSDDLIKRLLLKVG